MKRLFFFLLSLCQLVCYAQHYRHIGVENGLSSRKVYSIQKDLKGYMWFLTHNGIDQYDGSEFTHYRLISDGKEASSLQDLNWLYIGRKGNLWQIGRRGKIFKYDHFSDRFDIVYQLPAQESDNPTPISFSFIDNSNTIWLCSEQKIFLFNNENRTTTAVQHNLGLITYVVQYDDTQFFVGTETGIHYVEYKDQMLVKVPIESLDKLPLQISELYIDTLNDHLYIGTFQRGIYVFDIKHKICQKIKADIADMSITRIKALNDEEILVATDGLGVYKINAETHTAQPFIATDVRDNNMMTGNNIHDIYIDSESRIWLANYPSGITIRDDRYWKYRWIRHFAGNTQSLVNNRVNAMIEDSDGDIWFATNNGISLYCMKTNKWRSFLSTYNDPTSTTSHTFLALCEARPGVIYAAGYCPAIYAIDKKSMTASALSPSADKYNTVWSDKYIQVLQKDMQGNIWIGGFFNLKSIDKTTREIRSFPELSNITTILEHDEDNMWIGSGKGLFLLNKQSGEIKTIAIPIESAYVYSLCQPNEDQLYIGTNGSGLLVYDLPNETFTHYHKKNNELLSNNIYTILCDKQDNIVFSSEVGLTLFSPENHNFYNWTKEQGLKSNLFNVNSGIFTQGDRYIFGSSEGAIEFNKDMQWPREYSSKLIFSEFRLFCESVYPGKKDSPLDKVIDETDVLRLNYDQNIFSIKISSINYDYPSNILYSWKLEGFYNNWSPPGREKLIRFTNLDPGEYTLHIRAISNENRQILEERTLGIIIAQPFWQSIWGIILYGLLFVLTIIGLSRLAYMRKQRKMTNDKVEFFVNTAHDIRTPLTLIKSPLEEVKEKEHLTGAGARNMNIALRNVNILLRLTTNLINFERMDLYSSNLYVSEYELNAFMREIIQSFNSFAEIKKVKLEYNSSFSHLNVWFDKEKMDSVFKNVISNAVKYTLQGGSVTVSASETSSHWEVEVKDTGIGIPASEQTKAFKTSFRARNAINLKVTGSGIGMVLASKQVKYHKGKITMNSVEHKGTTIKLSFPKGYDHYNKEHLAKNNQDQRMQPEIGESIMPTFNSASNRKRPENGQRVLVVEDNDELRNYLHETLSEEYNVQTCENGRDALVIIKEFVPELIISDIMMPEMRGDELCEMLKDNIETSHIPIILLTALNDEQHIIKGLHTGADRYIVKPFNISILKATIANLLTNRAILRSKYANLEIEQTAEEACNNCTTGIDWKFISELRSKVEEHIEDPHFNIDLLAADMNMSRTSLYNKIKALTDLSPSDYVRSVRLNKAAELLLRGHLSVTEVSEKTGFSDVKYFREVFKKRFDVSPSKYNR